MDEVDVHDGFEVLGGRAVVGINDADNAKTSEFDETLVGVSQAIANYRPDAADHREVFYRDVATAI